MHQPIYLDYSAATPADEAAVQAAQPFLSQQFYNPSAIYQPARRVRQSVEAARARVADVLGAKDQEIIFTAGGTEANNLAIHGVMRQFPSANIIVSSIEHESVLEPASLYERRLAPVTKQGLIDLTQLEALIDEKTVLVSVMYANNEIGTIQPLKEIARLITKKRAERINSQLTTHNYPLYLHTDACQAANYLDLQVSRLGIDLLSLNGGKIYAFKQSGCLYVRSGVKLGSVMLGGGQEEGLRSGTENVAALQGFATMLQKVQSERKAETGRLQILRDQLFATLSHNLKGMQLNGHPHKRLPNNLNFMLPGADGERLVMELDEAGLLAATGSACSASNDEPSHVLRALGLSTAEASASLRLSLGRLTTPAEIEQAAKILITVTEQHAKLL